MKIVARSILCICLVMCSVVGSDLRAQEAARSAPLNYLNAPFTGGKIQHKTLPRATRAVCLVSAPKGACKAFQFVRVETVDGQAKRTLLNPYIFQMAERSNYVHELKDHMQQNMDGVAAMVPFSRIRSGGLPVFIPPLFLVLAVSDVLELPVSVPAYLFGGRNLKKSTEVFYSKKTRKLDQKQYELLEFVVENLVRPKLPCGQKGSLDERIASCSEREGSTDLKFTLVARDVADPENYGEKAEIVLDRQSGLLWGGAHYEKGTPDPLTICEGPRRANISLDGFRWRLPTEAEAKQAVENGMLEARNEFALEVWTYTPGSGSEEPKPFRFYRPEHNPHTEGGFADVRCVAEITP